MLLFAARSFHLRSSPWCLPSDGTPNEQPSTFACAARCMKNANCLGFTYNEGSCICHEELAPVTLGIQAPSDRIYVIYEDIGGESVWN